MSKFVPFDQRHGTIPTIPLVSKPVDVEDRDCWPEITRAIDFAREQRLKGGR